jgi:hypothetical protein
LIRDTLEIPSPSKEGHITLPYDHLVIETFVNILHSSTPVYSTITLEDFGDLYKLCDYFEAPGLVARVNEAIKLRLMMKQTAALEPWYVFKLAANRGDVDVMAVAIEHFGISQYHHQDFTQPDPSFYSGVPAEYTTRLMKFALVERMFPDPDDDLYDDHYHRSILTYVPREWAEVAKAFEKECRSVESVKGDQ